MLLSTQTDNVFAKCGIDEGLKIFAAAGYDALDYSMFGMTNDDHFLNNCDVEAFAKELRGKAEALGLVFNQAHAPFPCWRNGDEAYNAKMPARVANAIRIAGILGAKSIVVHPIAYIKPGDAQKAFNFDFYRSIGHAALAVHKESHSQPPLSRSGQSIKISKVFSFNVLLAALYNLFTSSSLH